MAEEAARSRLGRGLAALIGDVGDESQSTERTKNQRRLPIEFLRPNPRNPRRSFAEEELAELAASVRERGVLQPILARAVRGANDAYEIIAGERRWRAAQRAGLHEVPVVVIEATDEQSLEFAIIENVQRADLNAIEEAMGYEALATEFKHSQEGIAQIVGKSRSHVANTLRLLKLPEPVKAYIRSGKLSAGHARMLVGQPNAQELADDIVARGLNVRQVEALARDEGKKPSKKAKPAAKDADTRALEKRLTDALGLTVTIDHRMGDGAGTVHVKYRDYDQLDEIIRRLERKA
jgi:ParB family transcriptional regulator, chromosome partitioning protein